MGRIKKKDIILQAIKAEMMARGIKANTIAQAIRRHVPVSTTVQYLKGDHDTKSYKVCHIMKYLGLEVTKKVGISQRQGPGYSYKPPPF